MNSVCRLNIPRDATSFRTEQEGREKLRCPVGCFFPGPRVQLLGTFSDIVLLFAHTLSGLSSFIGQCVFSCFTHFEVLECCRHRAACSLQREGDLRNSQEER